MNENPRLADGVPHLQRRRPGTSRIAALAVVVAVLATVGLTSRSAEAQAGFDQVTLNPDPPTAWEPFTIQIEASGCEPDSAATFSAWLMQSDTDMLWFVEMGSVAATSDGSGAVSTSLAVPVAYPGDWQVRFEGCDFTPDLPMYEFEIAAPADLTLTAAGEVQLGEPFNLSIEGTGCPGVAVDWQVGRWVYPLYAVIPAEGTAIPDGDGSWGAIAAGHMPPTIEERFFSTPDYVDVVGVCRFADGTEVSIPGATVPLLAAETPPPSPPVVDPRYAG